MFGRLDLLRKHQIHSPGSDCFCRISVGIFRMSATRTGKDRLTRAVGLIHAAAPAAGLRTELCRDFNNEFSGGLGFVLQTLGKISPGSSGNTFVKPCLGGSTVRQRLSVFIKLRLRLPSVALRHRSEWPAAGR